MNMPSSITYSIARRILADDPLSLTFNRLDSVFGKADIQLHKWAYAQLAGVHDYALRGLMTEKLRKTARAAAKTQFWKSKFAAVQLDPGNIASCEDIGRLPITTRRELGRVGIQDRSDMRLPEKMRGSFAGTSGSTGNPITLYRGRKQWVRSKALFLWLLNKIGKEAGLESGVPLMVLNINIKFQAGIYEKTIYVDGPALEDSERRLKEIYPLLSQSRPRVLYTYPSNLKRLMYWLTCDGVSFDFLKAIIYTGEHLNEDEKLAVKNFFKCPVYSLYGTAECAFMAVECAQNKGFHLLKGWGYMEIASPDGDALPIGSHGRVIYTNFENDITPFIRYDLGDQGRIFDGGVCPCGIAGLKLAFEGRSADIITLPNGMAFALHRLSGGISRVFQKKIFQLQFQEFNSDIHLNIVPASQFDESETKELIYLCQEIVKAPVPVKINFVDYIASLPNGKTLLFIKER